MCDKLVFDLAQEVEGSPAVFVRKDWINILDNQNQSYVANQSVLDTSQLSNSNKYMSYREAYFSIPMLITMASYGVQTPGGVVPPAALFTPNTTTCDGAIGLKNWFGNIIHSFTVDYNGSTIIQQTPFINMWNSFKLLTSLSYNDIITQGCTIGFYPDNAESFEFIDLSAGPGGAPTSIVAPLAPPALAGNITNYYAGNGTLNNTNQKSLNTQTALRFSRFQSGLGNDGFIERQKWIDFDTIGIAQANNTYTLTAGGALGLGNLIGTQYGQLLNNGAQTLNSLWKSYISTKQNEAVGQAGVLQYSIVATVYLKHIHSFFNMIPLLKGVFIKMTMNLNNCSSTITVGANSLVAGAGIYNTSTLYQMATQCNSALGGSNMLMLASNHADNVLVNPVTAGGVASVGFATSSTYNGATNLLNLSQITTNAAVANNNAYVEKTYIINLSVGAQCLDANITALPGWGQNFTGRLSRSIYLYIPAYTFNPTFEQAYLSSPVKEIKYTDVYQYQVLNVESGGVFNNLLTNGIANVKSVLILPYYNPSNGAPTQVRTAQINPNSGFIQGVPVWQSPFDPAGCGPTSPLCHFTNFNVQVSGQNAIYNLQKYTFEQFNNQLYGQNAVNGGLTDGITSGLINRQNFDLEYCYYYVNIERMLPVEQAVPKSVQILGQNMSSKAVDLYCFIEYGNVVSIDAMTGARV
jgi:hypothetical protein